MKKSLTRLIWNRAKFRCEYCQLSQEHDDETFEIDRIISEKHLGSIVVSNLALSCCRCNSFKGSDISGRDPKTLTLTPLFNPRKHKWLRHFRWEGAYLVGQTPIGRTTVLVLRINKSSRVNFRRKLIEEGVFPPELDES